MTENGTFSRDTHSVQKKRFWTALKLVFDRGLRLVND